jgi:hypothetical protein
MELDEAIAAATPQAASLPEMEAKILSAHPESSPQRRNMAERGLAMVREGMGLLSALGHNLMLAESSHSVVQVYPKMMYRNAAVGGGGLETMTVHSQEELDAATADGWFDHPQGQPTRAPQGDPSGGFAAKPEPLDPEPEPLDPEPEPLPLDGDPPPPEAA